ncbi:hypothetical protein [Haloechinothrix halophila]|uniref:hypothetical protein n=1 Tax=Haloechinothrix halophila TaxID=1069073 RepID=UPI000429CFD4|nr:hypothetical protein [Haloechinothrix halophila]
MLADLFTDAEYPADPYPGRRPPTSFVHVDGVGYPLTVASGEYLVNGAGGTDSVPLDDWLAAHGSPPLVGRTPVLAYGSNACPSKLTWLRDNLGLTGPVVAVLAWCTGYSAVWTTGVRARDNQRTVTLIPVPDVPDVIEQHAVLLVTQDQLKVLDVCEAADLSCWGEPGRDDPRYRRELLPDGVVTVDGPALTAPVHGYVGCHPDRFSALVDGAPVRAVDGAFPAPDATNDAFAPPNGVKGSYNASHPTPPRRP